MQPMLNGATTRYSLSQDSGLTQSQLNVWIGQCLAPANPLYNMAFAFTIERRVDYDRLKTAWQRCLDASDSLRTSVEKIEGQPRRRILPKGSCALQYADLTSSPGDEFVSWAQARASKALPLDGELVDSILVKINEEKYGWYLNQHHLVTDATSTVILVDQVWQRYLENQATERDAQPISYYKLYEELDAKLQPRKVEARKFWEKRVPNRSTPIPLYGKHQAPVATECERIGFRLSKPDSDRLKTISGESTFQSFFPDTSLFTVFATLFATLLRRISGESDIYFEAPLQCRPTAESKRCIGCFMELFPLNLSATDTDTFRDLGDKCREYVQELLSNALPGTQTVARNQSNNAILNFFPGSFTQNPEIGLATEWLHPGHMDVQHEIRLLIHDYDHSGEFHFQFELDCESFSQEKRRELVESFQIIMRAFLVDREIKIDEIEILPERERRKLLVDYNRSGSKPTPKGTIIDRFLKQVQTTPDRIAIRDKKRSLTFEELSRKVDGLAQKLYREFGRDTGAIAILMKRSIDVVISILAILRSGNHYVPIDPNYPKDRINHILIDSNSKLLLSQRELAKPLLESSASIWCIEDMDFGATQNPAELPTPLGSDLAYMLYTSGSTGKPKGVEIEHCGLLDYIDWAARTYLQGQVYNYPLFTSLSFDLTVTSLYLPLVSGGTLLPYEETAGAVDSSLISVINENEVQFIKLTPSHLELLKQMDLAHSAIKKMVVGGEDLKCDLATRISEQFRGKIEIFNEYGPTEAVVGCMIHKFDPDSDPNYGTSVPIGKPADHVQLYALNGRRVPVPAGVPAELYISRHGLARGYHNNERQTTRSFLDNPFQKGKRFYRTGDLVRFNENGLLVYLGRVDEQLKISGYRIEPREVETALCAFPGIHSAYVTATAKLGIESRLSQLVAYYVAEQAVDPVRLTDHLRKSLPTQLIPAYFTSLHEIPLTVNGKVDTKLLPIPDNEDRPGLEAIVEPAGPVEKHVSKVWSLSLGKPQIGASDDFFKLGGTSLLAMEVSLHICKDFEIDIPLQTLFQYPALRDYCNFIETTIVDEIAELSDEEAQTILEAQKDSI